VIAAEFLDRFQFHNELIVNQEVEPVIADEMSAKRDRHFLLRFERNVVFCKLNFKRPVIHRLQKTRPKFLMYTYAATDYLVDQLFKIICPLFLFFPFPHFTPYTLRLMPSLSGR